MPEFRLRLLHLSDLHERGAGAGEPWRERRVLGPAWERNLDEIAAAGAIDLVCFTGDAANWGKAEELIRAGELLAATCERLRVPMERLFVVPGNHDIDRGVAAAAWGRLRAALPRADPLVVSRWLAGGQPPLGLAAADRKAILRRQAAYRRWLALVLRRSALLPYPKLHPHLGYRVSFQPAGWPCEVHVLGFDTSWLCGAQGEAGALLLTEDQVLRLTSEAGGGPLSGLRLALLHHPLGELADGPSLRARLAERTDLLLRGHLHVPDPQRWTDPAGRSLLELPAGCLYEGSGADRYPNSCQVVDLTVDSQGRPLSIDLWLRGWSPDGGHWFSDSGRYPGSVDGRVRVLGPRRGPAVRPVPRVFVGRVEELRRLAATLLESDESMPCLLLGMPGAGKSYLADRFAALHAGAFPGGYYRLVVDPLAPATAASMLVTLADLLGLSPDPAGLAERIAGRLLRPLSLLHVENVDSAAAAAAAAELASRLAGCALLVSARFRELGFALGWAQIDVEPFDADLALAQLRAEVPAERLREPEPLYRQLARELGGLPLALHLAAGHLRAGRSVTDFLARLRASAETLAPIEAGDPAFDEPRRLVLAAAFQTSLALLGEQLGAAGPRLLGAFQALAHAPASGFGESLGAALAGLSPADFEELAVQARLLSLLEILPTALRPDRAWRIHPLLAQLLVGGCDAREAEAMRQRESAWFLERLPQQPPSEGDEQGRRWTEVHRETDALIAWLARAPAGERVRIERAGSRFAIFNGPFGAWLAFCDAMLGGSLSAEERSDALWTLANVARQGGVPSRALAAAREKRDLDIERGDEREAALASGAIADVLQARGELDKALRIRREEQLPVYERLGDVRERAVTLGLIADIFQAHGELDEALRIRREEELPVYDRLGDVRERAVTLGRIADVLQARGEFDEALRIRREEEIPVYERLGDVRAHAVTLGEIADVLQVRGDLDEALRIRREEQLPVYERLGDVRSRAVTLGKIADVLQARGELDEALRLRREEELPVFERLGDVRERAITLGKVAGILQARGELDEALRLRREEELPVYERLGLKRDLLIGRAELALALLSRGSPADRVEASRLLEAALATAVALGLPEADTIRQILGRHGLDETGPLPAKPT